MSELKVAYCSRCDSHRPLVESYYADGENPLEINIPPLREVKHYKCVICGKKIAPE